MAINTIKLKNLLQARSSHGLTRNLATCFPPVEIGSPTLVDQIVLLALDELTQPRVALEIGTYLGYTTRLFLQNSQASIIYSVDLPSEKTPSGLPKDNQRVMHDGAYNDEFLRSEMARRGEIYLGNLGESTLNRLRLIKANSMELDFRDAFGHVDLAFIDGGHSLENIRSDTEKTLEVLKDGVIIWHDYSSQIHSDVSDYLNRLSSSVDIFHVHGSLCAFSMIGPVAAEVLTRILT